MSRLLVAILAVFALPPGPAPMAQFDHLVVAIRSLDEGVAEFERLTGVRAQRGGQHPGRGTENALVSLGGHKYLEIIAPQPGATLAPRDQKMATLDRLHVIAWAVSVPDVQQATKALHMSGIQNTPIEPGARVTPTGEKLEWSTFALSDRSITVAPFFINWSAGTRHPSTTAPGGCTLGELTIRDPASNRLATALKTLGVEGIAYATGQPRIDARITCGDKTVTLTSPE